MQEGLYAIVGSEGRSALDTHACIGDAAPFAVVAPASESEVCALLEYTHAMRAPCVIAGGGTHLTHLTPPERAWWLLSTRRMNCVVDYSPADLVLTVGAGMTLRAVQDMLREHHQYLPWNPALPGEATIGGIIAGNRAGSWRYRFGAPRDRLLGVRAVTPDGVAFKSGAKVVKSVAGYDIHRLLCGSWGTLAVLTEITLKVQPLPQQFDAVGWRANWATLAETLDELMTMPIQPDGISVLALRETPGDWVSAQSLRRVETLPDAESAPLNYRPMIVPTGSPLGMRCIPIRAGATVLERPPVVAPLTTLEPQVEPLLQTEQDAPAPYILLEFSGRAEGVAWQIDQVRARGYPAEPVSAAMLEQLRDWLAPRRHALLLQILMRPSEIADAAARWSELTGVSVLAHAGNGVLYVAVDESGLNEALVSRIRAQEAKYRVLSGADWLRAHSSGELPRMALTEGERSLMRQLKRAFDERGILPELSLM